MWTQGDIDKLKEAVRSGILTVRYDGPPARSITYQDLGAMRALLAEMNHEVKGGTPYRLAQTKSGFRGGGGGNWGNNTW